MRRIDIEYQSSLKDYSSNRYLFHHKKNWNQRNGSIENWELHWVGYIPIAWCLSQRELGSKSRITRYQRVGVGFQKYFRLNVKRENYWKLTLCNFTFFTNYCCFSSYFPSVRLSWEWSLLKFVVTIGIGFSLLQHVTISFSTDIC